MSSTTACQYLCPGEEQPISQAIHLGRLATFYPACSSCSHREDTATLSKRQCKQLAESARYATREMRFDREGISGTYRNQIGSAEARRLAAALGAYLWEVASLASETVVAPRVLIASDGRPLTAELLASVSEGLRRSGCDVVDVGFATSPALALAIDRLQANGGFFLGNPSGQANEIGIKLYAKAGQPLSAGGGLDEIERRYDLDVSMLGRTFGSVGRDRISDAYLEPLRDSFHALRPLRVVLSTASLPLRHWIQELTANVACEVVAWGGGVLSEADLARQIVERESHFGLWVDGDGEACYLVDERGRPVPSESIADYLNADTSNSRKQSTVEASREETFLQQRQESQPSDIQSCDVISSASGDVWFCEPTPSADGLKVLIRLLVLLSRGDLSLSEALVSHAVNV